MQRSIPRLLFPKPLYCTILNNKKINNSDKCYTAKVCSSWCFRVSISVIRFNQVSVRSVRKTMNIYEQMKKSKKVYRKEGFYCRGVASYGLYVLSTTLSACQGFYMPLKLQLTVWLLGFKSTMFDVDLWINCTYLVQTQSCTFIQPSSDIYSWTKQNVGFARK